MKTTLLSLFAGLTLLAFSAHAQNWTTITSGWRPHTIVTTGDRIWAASEGGLLQVNPATMELDILNTDQGLFSNFLSALAVDSSTGYLWIGHENGGINIYDPASGRIVQTIRDFYNDPAVQTVHDIFIVRDNIFVASDQGVSKLARYQTEELWVVLETYRGFANWSRPTEILQVAVLDSQIFAGGYLGVAVADLEDDLLNVDNWTNYSWTQDFGLPPDADPSVRWMDIVFDDLYLGMVGQPMFRWQDNQFQAFANLYGAFGITGDEDGTLYAVRRDGLYSMPPGDGQFELVDSDYMPRFVDATTFENKVWCALDADQDNFGGIASWDGNEFEVLYPNTPGGDQILALSTNSNGDVWAGARSSSISGFFQLHDGIWYPYVKANYPHAPFTRQVAINSIEFDQLGGTWVGTYGEGVYYVRDDSLFHFDANNSELRGESEGSNFILVNSMVQGLQGGIWVANTTAYNGRSLVYIPNSWAQLGPDMWDMESWVNFSLSEPAGLIERDSMGRLWIAPIFQNASIPLTMYDPNGTPSDPTDDQVYEYGAIQGAQHTRALSLAMSSDDILWIGAPEGLFYVDTSVPPNQVSFTRVYGALGQSVNALAVDPLNQVWVGTDFGLSLLGRDRFTWIEHYTAVDGAYPSGLADNMVTSLTVRSETGEVFVGTSAGLSVLMTPYRDFGEELGEIEVAPQPFVIGADPSARLQFARESLVADATIRVFSLSGRKLRTLGFEQAGVGGWDGRDDAGELVGSGVYYIVVTGPDGSSKTGKVAVVRSGE